MYYKKLISGNTIIEFANDWLGNETIYVNGRQVCKAVSILGMNHFFTIIENGIPAAYTLTTKVNMMMQILVDLNRDGKYIYQNEIVKTGYRPHPKTNEAKKKAMRLKKKYYLEEAIESFKKALCFDPTDADIYFQMACCYSIMEKSADGYECIRKAVKFNLIDRDIIFRHDKLAYLRMQDAFDDFANSGFKTYDTREMEDEGFLV